MSADNILCIVSNRGKVRVYDVGFSGLTDGADWDKHHEGNHEATKALIDHVVKYGTEVWSGTSGQAAEGFCHSYMRGHIVEYDYMFIGIDRNFEKEKI